MPCAAGAAHACRPDSRPRRRCRRCRLHASVSICRSTSVLPPTRSRHFGLSPDRAVQARSLARRENDPPHLSPSGEGPYDAALRSLAPRRPARRGCRRADAPASARSPSRHRRCRSSLFTANARNVGEIDQCADAAGQGHREEPRAAARRASGSTTAPSPTTGHSVGQTACRERGDRRRRRRGGTQPATARRSTRTRPERTCPSPGRSGRSGGSTAG